MRYSFALALLMAVPFAFASQPGHQLDCSDWVILQPGLQCSVLMGIETCGTADGEGFCVSRPGSDASGAHRVIDNEGGILRVVHMDRFPGFCGSTRQYRTELQRWKDGQVTVLAYVDDRCLDPPVGSQRDFVRFTGEASSAPDPYRYSGALLFDEKAGRVSFAVYARSTSDTTAYATFVWAFSGFTTLFDVLQTYAPQADSFGFRVPYMPEGLAAVDHFDSYWGPVSQQANFAQAHPLQCAYPNAPPVTGQYLTIDVPVPTPTPGTANYVITSVTYQGQTRAGRKASAGRLTGRDASRLPACVQE